MSKIKEILVEIDDYFSSQPNKHRRLIDLRTLVSDAEFQADARVIAAANHFGISTSFLTDYFEKYEGE